MKKVTIVDKSTLSQHLSTSSSTFPRDIENYQFQSGSNLHDSNQGKGKGKDIQQPYQSHSQDNLPVSVARTATTFNPHLNLRATTSTPAQSSRFVIFPNNFSAGRRHMYSKASDRAVAINERIERMARKWTSFDSSPCTFDELAHPGRAFPVFYFLH